MYTYDRNASPVAAAYFSVKLGVFQRSLRVARPQHLNAEQSDLRRENVLELDELEGGRVGNGVPGLLDDMMNGRLHCVEQFLQP